VNAFWTWPLPLRLTLVFVVGAWVGSLVNWAVYRLATEPRPIGPWARRHPDAPRRRGADYLPIAGWMGLAREDVVHGERYWLRPLIVELCAAFGLAALYWWEIDRWGLLFGQPVAAAAADVPWGRLHVQFVVHGVLIALMLVASLIDADEKIIPDGVTVPGTLLGLILAASYPPVQLPLVSVHQGQFHFAGLQVCSPNAWYAGFDGPWGLALGAGCLWGWSLALLPTTWYSRHGVARAAQLLVARLVRSAHTWLTLGIAAIGSVAIFALWNRGGPAWQSLLSSLVGLAAGGGLVWTVRIIGTAILQREAMGFGDVTLMAMLGTFFGWQGSVMIFFLAPLAALLIGVISLILRRESEIAYGPFLCLAALALLVGWADFWARASQFFALGLIVPAALLVCMVLLALILGLIQLVKAILADR